MTTENSAPGAPAPKAPKPARRKVDTALSRPHPLWRALVSSRLWLLFVALAALVLQALLYCAPQETPVAVYKLALMLTAGVAGYLLDRALFPYASPCSYLAADWRKDPHADRPNGPDYPVVPAYKDVFRAAMLRQAIIVAAAMLAVSLGL